MAGLTLDTGVLIGFERADLKFAQQMGDEPGTRFHNLRSMRSSVQFFIVDSPLRGARFTGADDANRAPPDLGVHDEQQPPLR